MLIRLALLAFFLSPAQQPSHAPPPVPPEVQAEIDRSARINQLAAEDKIKTEADARLLVDELAWSIGLEKPEAAMVFGRQIELLKTTVARAEFAAVHDGRRISEGKIVAAWNALMDEVGTPNWTRLTASEFHYERDALATISLMPEMRNPSRRPALFARRPDGNVQPDCRPTEAVYILWMLQQSPSNFEVLHKAAAEGVLVSEKVRRAREKQPQEAKLDKPQARVEAHLEARVSSERSEYNQAWMRYFETHAFDRLPQRLLEIAGEALGGK